jgi:hypothetical protein
VVAGSSPVEPAIQSAINSRTIEELAAVFVSGIVRLVKPSSGLLCPPTLVLELNSFTTSVFSTAKDQTGRTLKAILFDTR